MIKKDSRYYLAIGIGQYIIEGHTKVEALEEFNISRRTFDNSLKRLADYNYKLYVLAKQKLNKNRGSNSQKAVQKANSRAIEICEFIVSGHTRAEASKKFSVSLSTVDNATKIVREKNPELYKKLKEQLLKNMYTSNTPNSISI